MDKILKIFKISDFVNIEIVNNRETAKNVEIVTFRKQMW